MGGPRVDYCGLPVSLRGSPGAMGRFRQRRAVVVDPWAVFAFLATAVGGLLLLGWFRRMVAEL